MAHSGLEETAQVFGQRESRNVHIKSREVLTEVEAVTTELRIPFIRGNGENREFASDAGCLPSRQFRSQPQ